MITTRQVRSSYSILPLPPLNKSKWMCSDHARWTACSSCFSIHHCYYLCCSFCSVLKCFCSRFRWWSSHWLHILMCRGYVTVNPSFTASYATFSIKSQNAVYLTVFSIELTHRSQIDWWVQLLPCLNSVVLAPLLQAFFWLAASCTWA